MPTLAPIVINDGEATPVAHTFAPDGNTGTEANYADRASGISQGFPRLKTNLAAAQRNQPLNKVRIRLSVPKMETISGSSSTGYAPAPRLAYIASFDGTLIFHERATEQERKNVRIMLANLLQSSSVVALVDKLEPAY